MTLTNGRTQDILLSQAVEWVKKAKMQLMMNGCIFIWNQIFWVCLSHCPEKISWCKCEKKEMWKVELFWCALFFSENKCWLCAAYRYGAFSRSLDLSFPAVMEKSMTHCSEKCHPQCVLWVCVLCWAVSWCTVLVWAQVSARVTWPKTAICFCTCCFFSLNLLQVSVLSRKNQ